VETGPLPPLQAVSVYVKLPIFIQLSITKTHTVMLAVGPDLRGREGANLTVALGPPQLRGLHEKVKKNIT